MFTDCRIILPKGETISRPNVFNVSKINNKLETKTISSKIYICSMALIASHQMKSSQKRRENQITYTNTIH